MTTALSNIEISLEGVGHVLRDRTLAVPPYQRPYSWRDEEVESFWWDLRSAFDAAEPDYFLGTIVLTGGQGGQTLIIDGQQRLTTTAILFTAIRDEFLARGDVERAGVIEADYLAARDLRSRELRPRVTLNAEDDAFFRAGVLARPDQRSERAAGSLPASNQRLAQGLALLSARLNEHVQASGPAWEETLFRWIDLLEQQIRAITVQVADDADAFLIFETLNDRGLALTITDLLKNRLFTLAREDVEEVQAAWLSALDTIVSAAEEETYTTFLRHYWSSLHGSTRERELYSRLRDDIRTRGAARSFAHALDEVAPLYAGLLNSSHPVWHRWEGLGAEVESLLRLGLEQNRPLLLAAMQYFDDPELRRLFRGVVSWSVRGLVVGGIGGGTTERYYAEAATRISSRVLATTDEVLDHLSPVVPTDDVFARQMEVVRVNKTRLARYYLVALHSFETGDPNPELVTTAEEDAWGLQLALPRRPDPADWDVFPPEALGQWANRLGNQFVLARGTPPSGGSPNDAALFVASHGLPRQVSLTRWTPDDIAARQVQLAAWALEVWPRVPR